MEKPIVTAAQMKRCDSYTINHIGIPSLVLMERAALAVRDEILNALPIYLSHVVVVAGSGNNGGDGLAVARLLKIAGARVTILNVGNPDHASQEHQIQAHICQYYRIPQTSDLSILDEASLIVDAIFGIGIDRPVAGHYVDVIKAMNDTKAFRVTVTFAFNKIGLTQNEGRQHAGRVVIADDMGTYWIDEHALADNQD